MSPEPDRDPVTDPLLHKALRPLPQAGTDGCVDAETLAAWADGNLPADEAADVEAHLAGCSRCQAVLAAFAMTDEPAAAASTASVIPFTPRSPVRWLLPLAASIAATLVLYAAVRNRPAPAPELQQTFAKAQGQQSQPEATAPAMPAAPSALAEKPVAAARKEKTLATNAPKLSPAPSPVPSAAPAANAGAVPLPAADRALAVPPPPPPPPATVTTPVANAAAARGDLSTTRTTDELLRADSAMWALAKVVAEFAPPTETSPGFGRSFASGGGGRGGGGGGATAAGAGGRASTAPAQRATPHVRWRVLATGQVLKSTNDGEWAVVTITPTVFILNGHAPSPTVCWLVGRAGIVMLSTDGTKFTRVLFPDLSDLRSITAIDAHQATVTTTDGRVFTTENAGETWQLKH